MKILAFLIFCIAAFSAYSQSSNLTIHSTKAYNVQYPANWKMDTSKVGVEFVIFSPKESDEDKFSENVNLMIQDLSGQNIDLDKYAQISEEQIKKNAIDLKGFTMSRIQTISKDYYKLTYEMTYGDFKLFTEQYYFVKNEKAFVITFSSEINKSNTAGENILESFTIVK